MPKAVFRYRTDNLGNFNLPKGGRVVRFALRNPEALQNSSDVELDSLTMNVWALIDIDQAEELPFRIYPVRTGDTFPDDHEALDAVGLVQNMPQVFIVAGPGTETEDTLGVMFRSVGRREE